MTHSPRSSSGGAGAGAGGGSTGVPTASTRRPALSPRGAPGAPTPTGSSATTAVATGVCMGSKGRTTTGSSSLRMTTSRSLAVMLIVGPIQSVAAADELDAQQRKPPFLGAAVATRSAAASWWPRSAASRRSMRPSAVFFATPPVPGRETGDSTT